MTSLGQWTPNVSLAERLQASASGDHRSRYLYAEEQKLVCDQLALNEPHIVALALRGTPSKAIAAIYGVSREAIDKRLRRLGMKNPPGVHGRPRKTTPA